MPWWLFRCCLFRVDVRPALLPGPLRPVRVRACCAVLYCAGVQAMQAAPKVSALPVVCAEKLVGLITLHALVSAGL